MSSRIASVIRRSTRRHDAIHRRRAMRTAATDTTAMTAATTMTTTRLRLGKDLNDVNVLTTGFHPVRDKKVEKNPSLVLIYGSVESY